MDEHGSCAAGSLDAGPPSLPPVEQIGKVESLERPVHLGAYDPVRHTANVRGMLAGGLTAAFVLTIAAIFGLVFRHDSLKLTIEQIKDFGIPILSTEAALLGSALGFYFGDKSTR